MTDQPERPSDPTAEPVPTAPPPAGSDQPPSYAAPPNAAPPRYAPPAFGPTGMDAPPANYDPMAAPPRYAPPIDPLTGQPMPGYAYGTMPPPPPPVQPKTDRGAIIALVLGVIGGLFAPFAAFSSLRRIGRSNGALRGRGLAIASLVLCAGWIGFYVIQATGGADRDANGQISDAGSVDATAVQIGDCLKDLADSGEISSVNGVPCTQPHDGQMLVEYTLTGDNFPGVSTITDEADTRCGDLLVDAISSDADFDTLSIIYLYPTNESWDKQSDRLVICGVVSDVLLTRSLQS